MAASVTALATVVWSDLAEASQAPQVLLADELPVVAPVKLAKVDYAKANAEAELEELMEKKRARKRRIDFGNFEGY